MFTKMEWTKTDEQPLFQEDDAPLARAEEPRPAWRVLVVDDDQDVRQITALTLRGVVVDRAPVELIQAGSFAEAKAALSAGAPVAVGLVDVIMETQTAGLDFVVWARRELGERDTRFVIRTGQPGEYAEKHILEEYDIHDFLSKTETSGRTLRARVVGAVRAWRDIVAARAEAAALRHLLRQTAAFGPSRSALLATAPALLSPPRGEVQPDPTSEGAHLGAYPFARGARLAVPVEAPLSVVELQRVCAFGAALDELWPSPG
jgi:CheY-like chemotaxis protein